MAVKYKGHSKKGKRRRIQGWMKEWPFLATVAIVIVVVIVLVIASLGYLDTGPSHSPNNKPPYVQPRAMIDMDKSYIYENGTITFDGADSKGDIQQYLWDFGDGAEGNGPVVPHSYTKVGKLAVRLTVIDTKGAGHTDTVYVHISHKESQSGSISIGQSKDYVLPVENNCMGAKVVLTYPTGQIISGSPSNVVDITIYYPNGTVYMDTKGQEPGLGSTQIKEIDLPNQVMAAAFYQDWKIRVSASSGIGVKYEMDLDVHY
jgi:PKD repeat protein